MLVFGRRYELVEFQRLLLELHLDDGPGAATTTTIAATTTSSIYNKPPSQFSSAFLGCFNRRSVLTQVAGGRVR